MVGESGGEDIAELSLSKRPTGDRINEEGGGKEEDGNEEDPRRTEKKKKKKKR